MTKPESHPPQLELFYEHDLVIARIRGPLDEPVARCLQNAHDELAKRFGYALQLHDARQETELTADGRRSFFLWNRERAYPGVVAILGAHFALRAMAMLLMRAVKMLVPATSELAFFDTEADARAWLARQRIALEKEVAAKVEQGQVQKEGPDE